MNTSSIEHLNEMFHILTTCEWEGQPPCSEKIRWLRHQLSLDDKEPIQIRSVVARTCQVLSNTTFGSFPTDQVIDRLIAICIRNSSCGISQKCLHVLNVVKADIAKKNLSSRPLQLLSLNDRPTLTQENFYDVLALAVDQRHLEQILMCFNFLANHSRGQQGFEPDRRFLWTFLTTQPGSIPLAILCTRAACLIHDGDNRDICLRFLKERRASQLLRTHGTFEIRIIDDDMNLIIACVYPEILSNLNVYFASLMNGSFHEGQTKSMVLLYKEPELFLAILDFIHGMPIFLNMDNVYELLRLADCYMVAGLKEACERFLNNVYDKRGKLTSEELQEEIDYAQHCNSVSIAENLVHKIIRYILLEPKNPLKLVVEAPYMPLLLQYRDHIKTLDLTRCLPGDQLKRKIERKDLIGVCHLLPNLTSLNLSHCENLNEAAVLEIFKNINNLQKLNLCDCSAVALRTIHHLAKFKSTITSLNLAGCILVDYHCMEILTNNLLKLKSLNLRRCPKIRDSGLILLAESALHLESLEIGGFQSGISDYGLKSLAINQTALKELDMSRCVDINNTSLVEIGMHLSKLESLNLTDCKRITDQGVVQMTTRLTTLKALHLSLCFDLTNISLAAIEVQLPNLEVLGLARCNKFKESGLISLLYHLNMLKDLNLMHCPEVTDKVVSVLSEYCPLLEKVNLGLTQITNSSVKLLLKQLTKLRHLDLQKCERISDSALEEIFKEPLCLESINLTGCAQISKEMQRKLIEKGIVLS